MAPTNRIAIIIALFHRHASPNSSVARRPANAFRKRGDATTTTIAMTTVTRRTARRRNAIRGCSLVEMAAAFTTHGDAVSNDSIE